MLNSNKGSYLYGPGGQLLESYRAWNDTTDYVYFGGRLLYTLSTGEHGYTAVTRMYSDRLGSTRATQTQEYIWNSTTTRNYYPYGEEIGSTANDQYKFASTYRDSTTGLDYAVNRYYASTTARFLTVDPLGHGAAKLTSSISWNLYAYSRNDPVNTLDAAGLDAIDIAVAVFDSRQGTWCSYDENGNETGRTAATSTREGDDTLRQTWDGDDVQKIVGGEIYIWATESSKYGNQRYSRGFAQGKAFGPRMMEAGQSSSRSTTGIWTWTSPDGRTSDFGTYRYDVTITTSGDGSAITTHEQYWQTQWDPEKQGWGLEYTDISHTYQMVGKEWYLTNIDISGSALNGDPKDAHYGMCRISTPPQPLPTLAAQ